MRNRLERLSRECDEAKRDPERQKELAEIASNQVQMVGTVKSHREAELKMLTDHIAALESRGGESLLIYI